MRFYKRWTRVKMSDSAGCTTVDNLLTSLNISFLICRRDVPPTSLDIPENQLFNALKPQHKAHGPLIQKHQNTVKKFTLRSQPHKFCIFLHSDLAQVIGNCLQFSQTLLKGWRFQFINGSFFQIENPFIAPGSWSAQINSTTVTAVLLTISTSCSLLLITSCLGYSL